MKKLLSLALILSFGAGCSHVGQKTKPESYSVVERPPAGGVQQQQVADRAAELRRAGESPKAALKQASGEFPDTDSAAQAEWARKYSTALKEKAAQEKFENDLNRIVGK